MYVFFYFLVENENINLKVLVDLIINEVVIFLIKYVLFGNVRLSMCCLV